MIKAGRLFVLCNLIILVIGCTLYNPFRETTYNTDTEGTPVTTQEPTGTPGSTPVPTGEPTAGPTTEPTAEPTIGPTAEPTTEPTAAPTGEKYPTYTYRMPIQITDNSSSTLSDFQILLVLNTGNFTYAHVSSPSGFDIRFDHDDIECSYWIETWNTSGESRIWIKVPHIAADQTETIYMYYGDATADPMSNGNSTFLLFDNFNDNSLDSGKWVDVSSDDAYIEETGQVLRTILDDANGSRGFARSADEITETNIALHFSIQFEDTSDARGFGAIHWDGEHGVAALWDLPDNCFAVDWMDTGDIMINEYVDGSVATLESISGSCDLNWHDFQLRYYNGELEVLYDNTDTISTISTETFSANYIGFMGRKDGTYNNSYDDVFVRKYESSEPDVVPGSEELNS